MSVRTRIGVMVPSTNTSFEADFQMVAPRDVTVHGQRLWLTNEGKGDEVFNRMNAEIETGARYLATAKVDVIVTPTAPTPAFRIGEKTDDPVSMYLADIYTVTASLAGICGVSVPCGVSSEGLPIGAQVLGPHFGESTVFRAARGIEELAVRS